MSASKKRKVSGLSGLELDITLTQLRKFRSTLIVEDMPVSDTTPADPLADELDNIISTLESRVNNPLFLSFLVCNDKVLERFNIDRKGVLFLQAEPTLSQAISTSRAVSSDKLWSDATMYKHLSYLVNCFADCHEASARALINTFFFRSTSMVPAPQKAIVMLQKRVSAVRPRPSQLDTISGIVDYTTVVADKSVANTYIRFPPEITERYGNTMVAFFVAEAKATDTVKILDHLPQVLLELVACARHLGKSHVRGALTTGFKWLFVVLDLKDDGADYWLSDVIEWKWKVGRGQDPIHLVEDTSEEPALIAGILSSWMKESFEKFQGDQWFYLAR